MNIIALSPQTDYWEIQYQDGKKRLLSGTVAERLVTLDKIVEESAVSGAAITESIIIKIDDKQVDLADYLSKKYQKPFIYSSISDYEQAKENWLWSIEDTYLKQGNDAYTSESLLTVGNGYIGIRGTTPEMLISDDSYPALYIAGLYDEATSNIDGNKITNEDFVNAPNLQRMFIKVGNEVVDLVHQEIINFTRHLDLKTGLFTSEATVKLRDGKRLKINSKRVANMAKVHEYSVQYAVTPINFSGELHFVSEARGDVYNYNVARYRDLNRQHLHVTHQTVEDNTVTLTAQTLESHIDITQMAQLFIPDELDNSEISASRDGENIMQELVFNATEGSTYTFDKTVWVTTSMTKDVPTPIELPDFNKSYRQSKKAWQELWQKSHVAIAGDDYAQRLLNLNTFHVLVSASPNAYKEALGSGLTARGLHGEAYRGHVFWDELYILPFYVMHFPETARELLRYRYLRLDEAKKAAKDAGYDGAMFPWQSGRDGSEQSQSRHLNPMSKQWTPDNSRLQRHVSLAIAYNVWLYWINTHDDAYMEEEGLELLQEITKFWQSTLVLSDDGLHYDIKHVMGPDEFHEQYPNAIEAGLTNNAYTNVMVAWLFKTMQEFMNAFPRWFESHTGDIEIDGQELDSLRKKLNLEINPEGLIAQYAHYFDLEDINWDDYRDKCQNIQRMDRILEAEGKDINAYKVAKQADTMMLFFNLGVNRVTQLLAELGYDLPENYVEKNFDYYLNHTSHGSTLSRVVFAALAGHLGKTDVMWQLYREALVSDYDDIQGGTTAEGIHLGVMASTIIFPLTVFMGIELTNEQLAIQPELPEQCQLLSFTIQKQQVHYEVSLDHQTLMITSDKNSDILVQDKKLSLKAGEARQINIGKEDTND